MITSILLEMLPVAKNCNLFFTWVNHSNPLDPYLKSYQWATTGRGRENQLWISKSKRQAEESSPTAQPHIKYDIYIAPESNPDREHGKGST